MPTGRAKSRGAGDEGRGERIELHQARELLAQTGDTTRIMKGSKHCLAHKHEPYARVAAPLTTPPVEEAMKFLAMKY